MTKGSALGPGELARAHWRKSSYSGTAGNCVEVADLGGTGTRAVRDSKHLTGPALIFTECAWFVFTAGVRVGEFD